MTTTTLRLPIRGLSPTPEPPSTLRKLLLPLLILLGLGAGYWAWQRWAGSERSARAYIPADALLVVESTELQQSPERILPHQVQLADVPVLGAAADQLRGLYLALGDSALVNGFLRGKTITYSLHSEGRNQLSFLVFIPIMPGNDGPFTDRLEKLVGHGVRSYRHTFENTVLNDVVDARSAPLFSYFMYDNYLVMSRSSQLAEGVVRKIKRLIDRTGWQDEEATVLTAGTQLFFNREQAQSFWAGAYQVSPGEVTTLDFVPARQAFKFTVNDIRTKVEAEAVSSAGKAPPALVALSDQQAQPIGCARLVSNHTAVFFHLSVSDAGRLKQEIRQAEPSELYSIRENLSDRYRVEVDSLYDYLTGEAALCQLESSRLGRGGKVLLLKTSNPRACADWLDYQAAKISLEDKQPRFEELVGNGLIRQINAPELPALWFGKLAMGFPKSSFFATVGDYLLVASDVQTLRTVLTDYASGNVWSRSARPQELLKAARPAQFTAIALLNRSWYGWTERFRPGWQPVVARSEESLRRLDMLLWQSRFEGGSLFTSLVGMKGGGDSNPNLLRRLFLQKNVPLEKPLRLPPFVLKAPGGGTTVFGQTVDNQLLQLVGAPNDSVRMRLEGPMVSPPIPVDYFGNGSLQYLLLTANRYYLLNRNGLRYDLFASNRFSELNPGTFNLLGYVAGNRDQLSLADATGDLFVLDKPQRLIRQLNRLPDEAHVLPPVQTVQFNKKPHLILLGEEGTLSLVNTFGQPLKPFPVNLKARFGGPVFLETGLRETDLLIQTVSLQGELMKINLTGEVVERRQLFRADKATEFRLLLEKSGRDWLITSQTGNTVGIHDQQGRLLFQVENADPATTTIEYNDFGADVKVLSVTTAKGTWLYSLRGQPLTERPLTSTLPVVVQFAESYNKLYLYTTTDRAVEVWTVKIR
jgi:hypothetical protein